MIGVINNSPLAIIEPSSASYQLIAGSCSFVLCIGNSACNLTLPALQMMLSVTRGLGMLFITTSTFVVSEVQPFKEAVTE